MIEENFKNDLYRLILENLDQDEGMIHIDELKDALGKALIDLYYDYVIKEVYKCAVI